MTEADIPAAARYISLTMPPRLRPTRIEYVVDGVRLRSLLSAAALDSIGDEAEQRRRAIEILKGALFRGRMIAKDEASYRYLAESIRMHPDQETLLQMLRDAGFGQARYHNLSGGIVALLVGDVAG